MSFELGDKKIVIMGNIGSGKTELAKELTKLLKIITGSCKLYQEPVSKNPILKAFYDEMKKTEESDDKYNKYAYVMEIYLLFERLQNMNVDYNIADRSLEEDLNFVRVLVKNGGMTK